MQACRTKTNNFTPLPHSKPLTASRTPHASTGHIRRLTNENANSTPTMRQCRQHTRNWHHVHRTGRLLGGRFVRLLGLCSLLEHDHTDLPVRRRNRLRSASLRLSTCTARRALHNESTSRTSCRLGAFSRHAPQPLHCDSSWRHCVGVAGAAHWR